MTNLPDGMRPGDEDPDRYCDLCHGRLDSYESGFQIGETSRCRECAECLECGSALTAANATWDDFTGGYLCQECAHDIGLGEEDTIDA